MRSFPVTIEEAQVQVTNASTQALFDGDDTANIVTRAITNLGANPLVRWLSHTDYLRGAPQDAELEITHLTPSYANELISNIIPSISAGNELYYIITGPGMEDGVKYEIAGFSGERRTTFRLFLKRASNL